MTEATYTHACATVSQEVLTHLLLRLAHLLQAGRRSRAPECPLSRPNRTHACPCPHTRVHMCTHIVPSTIPGRVRTYSPWESWILSQVRSSWSCSPCSQDSSCPDLPCSLSLPYDLSGSKASPVAHTSSIPTARMTICLPHHFPRPHRILPGQ